MDDEYRNYHVWAVLPGERSWAPMGLNNTREDCLDFYVRDQGLPPDALVYIVPSEHVQVLRVTVHLEEPSRAA